MVKESPKQASTEKEKKPRSSRVKKLVKKPKTAKVAVVAKPKVAVVAKPKVAKVAKVKPVSNRKINGKPVLANTTGINISPAKVKNIVSNYVLNKDAYSALKELKDALPRIITRVVDGKEVSEDYKGVPVSSLSQKTLDYIAFANKEYDSSQRDEFAKAKISALSDDAWGIFSPLALWLHPGPRGLPVRQASWADHAHVSRCLCRCALSLVDPQRG